MDETGSLLLGAGIALVSAFALELARTRIKRQINRKRFLEYLENRLRVVITVCEWQKKDHDPRSSDDKPSISSVDYTVDMVTVPAEELATVSSVEADLRHPKLMLELIRIRGVIRMLNTLAKAVHTSLYSVENKKEALEMVDLLLRVIQRSAKTGLDIVSDLKGKTPVWIVDPDDEL